jgi:hypothetical protein
MQKRKLLSSIAIALIILSGILFGLIFVVPFLPLSVVWKGILFSALVIGMEITWWTGVLLAGKQLITRYLKYLNPLAWFLRKNRNDSGEQPGR